MDWFVQSLSSYDSKLDPDIAALQHMNRRINMFSVEPFTHRLSLDKQEVKGPVRGCVQAVQALRGSAFVFLHDDKSNNAEVWSERLSSAMLNHDGTKTTWRELLDLAPSAFPLHVRPLFDLKRFAGFVIESDVEGHIARLQRTGNAIELDDPLWVSSAKQIVDEYRVAYVGDYTFGQQTRHRGSLLYPRALPTSLSLLEACREVTAWKSHDICVVDYCRLEGSNDIKIVEFNCWNCSGFPSSFPRMDMFWAVEVYLKDRNLA